MLKQISVIWLLLWLGFTLPVLAADVTLVEIPATETVLAINDPRVIKLEQYLESKHSPLAPYASVFVEQADKYKMPDWRLVVAITGIESSFGRAIPYNSYNPFGWANGKYKFASWEDAIITVTRSLQEKYIARGLDTVNKIAPVYCPPNKTWAGKVNYFMSDIEAFKSNGDVRLLAFTL